MRLPVAPLGFATRADGVLAHLGDQPDQLQAAIDAAQALLDDARAIASLLR